MKYSVLLLAIAVALIIVITPVYALTIPPGVSCWTQVAAKLGTETSIYSLTTYDDGTGLTVFGGTDPNGKLYKYNASLGGWTQVAAKLGAETYIFSLTTYDDGTGLAVFGGTAPNGKLYKYNASLGGWTQVAAKLGAETSIYSLTTYDDGTGLAVYGGTAPNGTLYKYNASLGNWTEVAAKLGAETYVLALTTYNDGTGLAIFGGTEPNGKLYKYNASLGGWTQVAAKLGAETYIRSLTTYDDGTGLTVFGGTDPNGKLYKYNASLGGWTQVAAKLGAETYIRSLTTYDDGTGLTVFGGTDPNGKLYKYNASLGGWTQVAAKLGAETYIRSLTTYDDGTGLTVFGGTDPNGKLYKYNASLGGWTQVAAKLGAETYIFSLTTYDDGTGLAVFGGTYPNGKLYKYTYQLIGNLYFTPTPQYQPLYEKSNYTIYASNITANISHVTFNITYPTRNVKVENVFFNESSQIDTLSATYNNTNAIGWCLVNVSNTSKLMGFNGTTGYPLADIQFNWTNTTATPEVATITIKAGAYWVGNKSFPMEGGSHLFDKTTNGSINVSPYAPRATSFTSNTTIGLNSSAVWFNDTSISYPPITAWNWSFQNVTGNNTEVWFSQSQNVTYTFGIGNWLIRLNASNSYGYNISPGTYFINVTAPTIAEFSGTPRTGATPLSVDFTDLSTGATPNGWAWFFGDEPYTQPWTQISASAGFPIRSSAASVVLPDSSIVLMGGYTGAIYLNDTWRSTDQGVAWTRINASAGWAARYGHSTITTPDGNIVMIGGYTGAYKNDTWRSTDKGVTWYQINASSGWAARYGHSTVVQSDGSIVLMGGYTGAQKNDVWKSSDQGATWTQINASAGWAARYLHSSVIMPDGSIILMGGMGSAAFFNDTWRSTDGGVTWTQINASSGWVVRRSFSVAEMPDSSIVLFGGLSGTTYLNDTWRSTDQGATWTQISASAGWLPRMAHTSVAATNGSIVLMGGYTGVYYKNDTWRFNPVGSNLQNPTHIYTSAGNYTVSLTAAGLLNYNTTIKTGYINVSAAAVAAPTANFTSNVTSGTAPRPVQFNDTSNNTPTGWNWSFRNVTGNNTEVWFSQSQNPVYTFGLGNWSIKLTANNTIGSNTTPGMYFINVSAAAAGAAPTANFTSNVTSGTAPTPVQFNDTSNNTPTGWNWSFRNVTGNNTEVWFSQVQNASYTFGLGNWSIKLNASNAYGYNITPGTYYINVSAAVTGAAPTANFTSNVTSGTAPTPVQFNDTSNNTPTGWNWSFRNVTGNNTEVWFSQVQNASYTFGLGNWSIKLNASNAYGYNTTPGTYFINVSAAVVPPVASFTSNVSSGNSPLPVQFNDTSTNAPTSWNWSFQNVTGNNTEVWFSQNQNPVYTFGVGNWLIRLTANNTYGTNTTPGSYFVNVSASALIANFTSNVTSGIDPTPVQFNETSTGTYTPTAWNWSFQNVTGNNTEVWFSQSQNPVYTFGVGNWSIKLNASTIDEANTTPFTYFINISPAIVAGFTSNVTTGLPPATINFTDTTTGFPEAWNWSFQNVTGNNTEVWFSQNQNPVYTFGIGNWSIKLTANNTIGSNTTPGIYFINISEGAPIAGFISNKTTGAAPTTILFTDTSLGTPTSWNWSFQNITGNNTEVWFSQSQNPVYTFGLGNWSIKLTANNTIGSNTTPGTYFINVSAAAAGAAPTANFTSNVTSGTAPTPVQFNDTSNNTPTSWNWSFGDGSLSTAQNPVKTYSTSGIYTVTLNASNSYGNNITIKTDYIIIYNQTKSGFTANITNGVAPLPVKFTVTDPNDYANQWKWDFGDGGWTYGGIQNVTHVYSSDGLFTVSETALNIIPDIYPNWTVAAYQAGGTENEMKALTMYDDGTGLAIYGGSSYSGQLYKYNRTLGNWSLVAAQPADTNTIYALTTYNDGTGLAIYGSTGSATGGELYKYNTTTGGWLKVAYALYDPDFITDVYALTTYDDGTGMAIFGTGSQNASLVKYNTTLANWSKVAVQPDDGINWATTSLIVYNDGTGQALFAGTKSVAELYKYNTSTGGKWVRVANTAGGSQSEIQSLVTYDDGTGLAIFGGTAYDSHLYKYNISLGDWSLVAGTISGERQITSLVTYDDGTGLAIFGGTGDLGQLHKYNASLAAWELVAQPPDDYYEGLIEKLLVYDDGTGMAIYGGTGYNYAALYKYGSVLQIENTTTRVDYINVGATPLTASFMTNVTGGAYPLAVKFTDTSVGSPTGWNWSFRNVTGNNTEVWFTQTNSPTYTFGVGNWSIKLTVNTTGNTNTTPATYYINVSEYAPVASFTSNISSGSSPLVVQFNDTSQYSPTSWNWTFGVGNYSDSQNPVYTFVGAGNYTVTLIATNAIGNNTTIRYIEVGVDQVTKTTTIDGTYTVVKFNLSGSSTASTLWVAPVGVYEVEYLVVGGGGGSNASIGSGGGGGGGMLNGTGYTTVPGMSYVVSVGSGGNRDLPPANGGNSSFGIINTTGGGGGGGSGQGHPSTGRDGGSGGGASTVGGSGGANLSGQGFTGGGSNASNPYAAGGGGGAEGAGSLGWGSQAGNGGIGRQSDILVRGVFVYYAGGGGGGGTSSGGGTTPGTGGSGGGGNGGTYGSNGYSGANDMGGGAGGSGYYGSGYNSNGGSGIVIIRYLTKISPSANFTSNTTFGANPLVVQFNDTSTGTLIVDWNWSFGEGNYSDSQNPIFTYEVPGTYTVNLTVSSLIENSTISKTNYITVIAGGIPITNYTSNVTVGYIPFAVQFTSLSMDASSWNWSFGDGSLSTSENPVKIYSVAGTYTVVLNASNVYGSNATTKVGYITAIAPSPPIADFTANVTSGAIPLAVGFTDLSVLNPDAWYWEFGDGTNSTTRNPSHTYALAGTYNVNLRATNTTWGLFSWNNKTAYITATPPVTTVPGGTGLNRYVTTHVVRFMCKDWSGAPIQNMNVTSIGVQSSLGSLDWVASFFGINLNETPILNTSQSATTDYGGSVVFLMVPTEKYRLDYVCETLGINESRYYYPKEEWYNEIFWTTPVVYSSYVISYTLYNATNGSYMDLGVHYIDISNHTTDNLTFWVKNSTGGLIYTQTNASGHIGDINYSYPIPLTQNGIYYWGFSANTTMYDMPINLSNYFRIEGMPEPVRIDLQIGTDAPALEIYNWIAVIVIMIIAFIFGRITIKFGIVIVPIMAMFFKFIGWLQTPWLLISIAVTLGIFWYMRYAEEGE
jgi:PKD repeat protein